MAPIALVGGPPAAAQQPVFPFDSPIMRSPDMRLEAPRTERDQLKFGNSYWQSIDYFHAGVEAPAPLVVVLGGLGDWVRHRVTEAGFHLAELPPGGRRPKADETMEAYVEALGHLVGRSTELGIDPQRIVVMGGGLNGHFAALFGTDPSLLERAGLPFASLQGVVSINGRGFDIPARTAESDYLRSVYRREFGRDPETRVELSPAYHLEAPNASAFLFLNSEDSEEARDQSAEMASALSARSTPVEFAAMPEPRDGIPETYFLVAEDGAGWELMAFLERTIGP